MMFKIRWLRRDSANYIKDTRREKQRWLDVCTGSDVEYDELILSMTINLLKNRKSVACRLWFDGIHHITLCAQTISEGQTWI